MNSVQNPSLLYKCIQRLDYDDALSILNSFEGQNLDEIYDIYNGKNCIHLIMEQPWNTKTEQVLFKVIQISKLWEQISKFHKSDPFENALRSPHKEYFNYLLKNKKDLLVESAIPRCLDLIVKHNLIGYCQTFLNNLEEKEIQWISKPLEKTRDSSFFQCLEQERIALFEIFIKHLTRIKQNGNKESIIFKPQQDGNTLLHYIAKNSNGQIFFQKLLQTKILTSSLKDSDETLFSEALVHLDALNHKGKTPIFVASKKGNKKMVEKFLEYGADFTIPCNRKYKTSLRSIKFLPKYKIVIDLLKEPTKFETPKEVTKDPSIRTVLEKAEYGLISISKSLPKGFTKIIDERKNKGLLLCCKDGKIEYAKQLINEGINPFICDEDENSLVMILINQKIDEEKINTFIDFLYSIKKINFEHINKTGDNLLTFALAKQNVEVATHLMEKYHQMFDPNHQNNSHGTALTLIAKINKDNKLLDIFLKFFSNLDFNKNGQGKEVISILYENLINTKKELFEFKELYNESNQKLKKIIKEQTEYDQELTQLIESDEANNEQLQRDKYSQFKKEFNTEASKLISEVRSKNKNLEFLKVFLGKKNRPY